MRFTRYARFPQQAALALLIVFLLVSPELTAHQNRQPAWDARKASLSWTAQEPEKKPRNKSAEKPDNKPDAQEKPDSEKKPEAKPADKTEKKAEPKPDSGAKSPKEKAAAEKAAAERRQAEEKSAQIRKVLEKDYPTSVADLRIIQEKVHQTVEKVMPATVGVRVGNSQGSGVIVSEDGYVLTAGHVIDRPGRNVVLILLDGRQVRGKSLGVNRDIDSGMIKITDKGKWPFVKMANADSIHTGQWCVATGHPGGYMPGRTPPVRLGRVLYKSDNVLCTDCTLVGGDSGGPLFNLEGEVIAIHSRIGRSVTANLHVPIKTYLVTWDRLVASESWGGPRPNQVAAHIKPMLGVAGDTTCRVTQVFPSSPAKLAGVKAGDVIRQFDGVAVDNFGQLATLLNKKRPGQTIKLLIARGDKTLDLKVRLGARDRPLPGGAEPSPVPEEKLKEAQERQKIEQERLKKEREQREKEKQERRRKEEQKKLEAQKKLEEQKKQEEKKAQEERRRNEEKQEESPKSAAPSPDRSEEKSESKQQELSAPKNEPKDSPAQAGRPMLGVANVPGAKDDACRIGRVLPGLPAERAGIRAGDVILKFDGEAVRSFKDLTDRVAASKPGQKVVVELRRGEETLRIELEIGRRPRPK